MPNPKPTRSDVCSRCGCSDSRYGGPRKLEWDHLGGEHNNKSVGWWLCGDGCHDLVSAAQRRDGDSWDNDPTRSQNVKDAWLISGAASRLDVFNKSFSSEEQADIDVRSLRHWAQRWLIAGNGDFNGEGSYRRPGGNPLANDITAAIAARLGQRSSAPDVARSERIDRSRFLNLFSALFEVDRQLPDGPRMGQARRYTPRTMRRLFHLAIGGHLSFLTRDQGRVNDTIRDLAARQPIDDPPDGLERLAGLVRVAERVGKVVAEAENLDEARFAVDALSEQWSTNPANQNRHTSN